MGCLWCDMTSVVSQKTLTWAAERNELSNGNVKILKTNCSLIKFCVYDSVSQQRWVKYFHTSTVISVKAISEVCVNVFKII